jgi:hypothetical protein
VAAGCLAPRYATKGIIRTMADLSSMEKRKLERTLRMSGGYILDFSNKTFDEFMLDAVGVEIYDEKYNYGSGSRANRMRAFWDQEPSFMVAQALEALVKDWEEYAGFNAEPPSEEFLKVLRRLKEAAPVPEIEAIQPNAEGKDFEVLAKAVRDSIERNQPEIGLDRLHTYLIMYFRNLCSKHGIEIEKNKPLHSLVGEYVKSAKQRGLIESEMTERILKSTISVMESFNHIRNNRSFAHDNEILNYHESLLIFGHVTSSIRFIESIELAKTENKDLVLDDDIPF